MANSQYKSTIGYQEMPENYIYISHLVGEIGTDGETIEEPYFIIPTDPDSIADSLGSSFQETSSLSRSAPVYTYSSSGPRDVQFSFKLHRDMMQQFNKDVSNYHLGEDEDYVDGLVRVLQSIAVPKYNLTNKLVEPPLVAVRIGEQLFVKGIVNGGVTVNYEKPLLWPDKKYAIANVQFKVSEIDPYDSTTVFKNGSFRGLTKTMKAGFYPELQDKKS